MQTPPLSPRRPRQKDREYDTNLSAVPPAEDMENEMTAEKILLKPLPISTPDSMDRQRMLHNQGYNMNMSHPDDPDVPGYRSLSGSCYAMLET